MEFRETLLAAQRNQQQKLSESSYYKARFDPPKKEQKQRDKLSANIKKFLAKKDEEEKQKKLEAQRKREELQAMRDPKALRKIQKTLKVIKSANKSVLEDAVDRDNTAVTLVGGEQPDQDDYGYESQEAAAIYAKMMQKYSKIPDEPKFPTGPQSTKKDLKGTVERVRHALQHEDDPVPHKRRRKTENGVVDKEDSIPSHYEPEKKEEKKPDRPKIRKPMPPPMDFNQLLKLAEQKKSEPVGAQAAQKKQVAGSENERPMTKKQRRDYEEEVARRQRRQERLDADKSDGRKPQREERPAEKERTEPSQRPSGFGRIPKLNDKSSDRNNSPKLPSDRDRGDRDRVDRDRVDRDRVDRDRIDRDRIDRDRVDRDRGDRDKGDKDKGNRDRGEKDKSDKLQREKDRVRQERVRLEREKERVDKEKDRIDRERLERLKAERERIDRELERLSKDKERLEKTEKKVKMENGKTYDRPVERTKLNSSDSVKKSIDLKSQNTYRIDKNSNDKKLSSRNDDRVMTNGHSSQAKVVPKSNKEPMLKNGVKDKPAPAKPRPLADGKPENGKRLADNKVPFKRPDDRGPGKTQGSQAGSGKPKISNSFDFDRHVNSLKKEVGGKDGARPADGKRRPQSDDVRKKQNRRVVDSESEYDSEMDDFIDDGEENMDYSRHIKEIFGYDKSKYRDMDDDDDPTMESSFARQQREEFISKKIGIMEDLEDMRLEAMEKKKSKKKRRISDD